MAKKNKNSENQVSEQSILGVENTTPTEKEVAEKEVAEKEVDAKEASEKSGTTYIMKVTHLSWGPRKSNHFYAYDKPVISKKVMGKKHGEIINVWLKAGWIEEGKY
jgi:hypothetical protein